jgi:electron transfer flavoprotein beta subunit
MPNLSVNLKYGQRNNKNRPSGEYMRIIVCIKQIRHTYTRTGMDPVQHFLTPDDSIFRVNPYDEAALELALRVKARQGNVEVILLTLGPVIAEAELRRCLALGADDLYRIVTEREPGPWDKSRILARAVKDVGADLILCGKQSLDRQNGQVAAFMAHHLGLPFVSAIVDLAIEDKKRTTVRRTADRGVREVIECSLPAVLSVEMGFHEPSLPTYNALKSTRSVEIKTLSYMDEIFTNKTMTARIFSPRPRPKKTPAPDSEAEAFNRIDQLLMDSRIEKKGAILEDDPESQVNGILSFLEAHGFIKSNKASKKG